MWASYFPVAGEEHISLLLHPHRDKAHFRRLGMCLQPFAMSQLGCNWPQFASTRFAHFDQAAPLLKVVNPQW